MSPRLAELTAHAQTLTSTGDLTGARAVLADALAPIQADPQRADPELAEAAALHARILITLGDPHGARAWARFAQAAQERLHGPQDERTLAAATTHAAVLQRLGSHTRAAELYADIVGRLTAVDGPESARVLAAQADLATAEHSGGHCARARGRLADAWRRHRRVYGDAALPGIKMLARLGAMERECGRDATAREHLALAQELCARYLPADHPLSLQIAALARAPATGTHVCRRVAPPDAAPGVREVPRPAPTGVVPIGPPHRPDELADDRSGAERYGTDQYGVDQYGVDQYGVDQYGDDRYDDRLGDDRFGGDRFGAVAGDGDHGWPPESASGTTTADEEQRPFWDAGSPDDDRLLPVPMDQPDRARSRRPLVIAGIALAGLVVAGAAVLPRLGADDPGDPDRAAAPAAPAASGAPPAAPAATGPLPGSAAAGAPPASAAPPTTPAPAAAPADVSLRDNRDSVTLEWRYPAGSEGPILISGGRAGQEQRAFQQLPAGTTNYVVYGLNEGADYCFTIAVVYSVESVASSRRVCTDRDAPD